MLRVLQIKFLGAERSARWILQEAIAFLLDLTCRSDRGGADIETPNGDTSLSLGPVYLLLGEKKMELELQHFKLHVFLRLESSFK